MFTIKADALFAILDKVAPHQVGNDEFDMIQLDCTRGWLHAVASGLRTIAVARTPVESPRYWVAPIAYDDALALRAWLDKSDQVQVEHSLDTGRSLLRFTEGSAQTVVSVAAELPDMHWRDTIRVEAQAPVAASPVAQVDSEDLAKWEEAGDDLALWAASGVASFVVTAGPDFIGVQLSDSPAPEGNALDGWAKFLRTRSFLHEGRLYEVGTTYLDRLGKEWCVLSCPAPGEEPVVVSADTSGVALPLSVVLHVGGYLVPVTPALRSIDRCNF